MKTAIILASVVLLGLIGFNLAHAKSFDIGEWSEWWSLGISSGSVKRIYDHENKLVCWVYGSAHGGGISCVPSLELGNPLAEN